VVGCGPMSDKQGQGNEVSLNAAWEEVGGELCKN